MHRKESKMEALLRKLYFYTQKRNQRSSSAGNTFLGTLLTLMGFTCLTVAAFAFTMIAGLIAAGISCFILAWLYGSPEPNSQSV